MYIIHNIDIYIYNIDISDMYIYIYIDDVHIYTILHILSNLCQPRVPIFLGIGKHPSHLYPRLGIVGSHEASIVNGNGTHLQGVW